jgi:hypothetical protein
VRLSTVPIFCWKSLIHFCPWYTSLLKNRITACCYSLVHMERGVAMLILL